VGDLPGLTPRLYRGVRLLLVFAAACVLALGAAACGDDDGDDGGGGAAEDEAQSVRLKVGVIPIADVAPLFLGQKKGFFKEEAITLDPQFAEGGAVILPSVQSGEFQIGFSNTISLLIAQSQGLPVKIITQGVLGAENEENAWGKLLIKGDGPIRTPQDLEGKKIAVNTLNNICDVTIKASLEKEGVDVSKLTFQEVPFPEMVPAISAGRVAAGCVVEPFVSQGESQGLRGLVPFYVNTAPNLTVATYFTTQDYIDENTDVVERFARAMNRSLDYAAAHEDEVRAVLTEYTEIPPEAIEQIQLPQWRQDLNEPTIETLADLSEKYGLVEEAPNVEELIWEGARQ
jgi:NitT/TauT family transport system substrate-binding protein